MIPETGFRNVKTREQQRAEKKILILRILFLAMILAGLVLLVWAWEKRSDAGERDPAAGMLVTAPPKEVMAIGYQGHSYVPRENIETTLLIGTDVSEDETRDSRDWEYSLADMLMLIVADKDAKTYTALQINRDTVTTIQMVDDNGQFVDYFQGQVTLANAYGGSPQRCAKNTLDAVRFILMNVEIDHYVTVTMDSVGILNDMVGGVTVEVMDDGIAPGLVKGQTVKLNGDQALRYVRARMSLDDSTNAHRMERQRQYLDGLMEGFRKSAAKDSSFVMNSLLKLSDYMVSDCNIQKLSDLVNTFMSYKQTDLRTLEGETRYGETLKDMGIEGRYAEFYPDQEALRATVMDLFYRRID